MSKWTATMVKEKLRGRHPATQTMGVARIPGPWTCLEEWRNIDLLAFSAHSGQRRIGYEVKVSRADYRQELRKGYKRQLGLTICHEFYFAVPAGLLTPDEIGRRHSEEKAQLALATDAGRALWVPEDVGLVVVDGRGCRVVVEAPFNPSPESPFAGQSDAGLHALIRWASARPDPRHDGVVAEARERNRQVRALRSGRAA